MKVINIAERILAILSPTIEYSNANEGLPEFLTTLDTLGLNWRKINFYNLPPHFLHENEKKCWSLDLDEYIQGMDVGDAVQFLEHLEKLPSDSITKFKRAYRKLYSLKGYEKLTKSQLKEKYEHLLETACYALRYWIDYMDYDFTPIKLPDTFESSWNMEYRGYELKSLVYTLEGDLDRMLGFKEEFHARLWGAYRILRWMCGIKPLFLTCPSYPDAEGMVDIVNYLSRSLNKLGVVEDRRYHLYLMEDFTDCLLYEQKISYHPHKLNLTCKVDFNLPAGVYVLPLRLCVCSNVNLEEIISLETSLPVVTMSSRVSRNDQIVVTIQTEQDVTLTTGNQLLTINY